MSFIELLLSITVVAIISTTSTLQGQTILRYGIQTAQTASFVQNLHTEFTRSSLVSTPLLLSDDSAKTVPRTIRFSYGESVTPSTMLLSVRGREDSAEYESITISIRGRITARRLPVGSSG